MAIVRKKGVADVTKRGVADVTKKRGGKCPDGICTNTVSRPIYVNVDSPNLGFPYFNFLGGYQ